jgi:hypothetical protein
MALGRHQAEAPELTGERMFGVRAQSYRWVAIAGSVWLTLCALAGAPARAQESDPNAGATALSLTTRPPVAMVGPETIKPRTKPTSAPWMNAADVARWRCSSGANFAVRWHAARTAHGAPRAARPIERRAVKPLTRAGTIAAPIAPSWSRDATTRLECEADARAVPQLISETSN